MREEQRRGRPAYAAIVDGFGPQVVGADGEIDRRKLAAIVFGDEGELARLEAIMHPRVRARIAEARDALAATEVLVVEAIKIIGGPLERVCDRVWVVVAPRDVLLGRLAARGVEPADAAARLSAQLAADEFRARADVVLDNSGGLDALERSVDAAWQALMKERGGR